MNESAEKVETQLRCWVILKLQQLKNADHIIRGLHIDMKCKCSSCKEKVIIFECIPTL